MKDIKDILNIIKTTLDIIICLKPLIISAWTKIKEYFHKEKKPLFNKINNKETPIWNTLSLKNTIIWI